LNRSRRRGSRLLDRSNLLGISSLNRCRTYGLLLFGSGVSSLWFLRFMGSKAFFVGHDINYLDPNKVVYRLKVLRSSKTKLKPGTGIQSICGIACQS